MTNRTDLLDVVDTAMMADHTFKIGHGLVMNSISRNECDMDDLTVLSCVLDRAAAQLKESIAITEKMRKAAREAHTTP